jgi:preprotein translocase subunit SecD
VLYFVAVGNVRGFAFTLGLTAVADLIVVFMFTHPVMQLLAHTRFFGGGHRLSGLDPSLLGREPLYQGAGKVRQFRPSPEATASKRGRKSAREADRRQTIAERRRAELMSGVGSHAAGSTTPADRAEEQK